MKEEKRKCQSCEQQFAIEPDDFDFYRKIQVPPPTWCFECRLQRRLVVRNERSFYKDTCDLCKKSILSLYSPDKPFSVYCKECWYSDKWDPLEYGVEYDFSVPFFVQFRKLLEKVPQINVLHIHTNNNADYANYVADSKNVYLAYSIVKSENVYYSRFIDKSKECFDSFNKKESEIVYENMNGGQNYNSRYLNHSRNCLNSSFLFDCVNCQNCFMSSNLRNKQYVFKNIQRTKEQYEAEFSKLNLGSFNVVKKFYKDFQELTRNSLHKFANITRSVDVSGDNVEGSKNCSICFDVYDSENSKFCCRMFNSKDNYDVFGLASGELSYETVACGFGNYNVHFSTFGDSTEKGEYLHWCLGSSNLFGSVGLQKKQYCILNKQYSKEEYGALVPKIIKHMNEMPYKDNAGRVYSYGEFSPPELSPFSYNETVAQEYFPLTKEKAEEEGYVWKESEIRDYKITVQSINLSYDINDVDNSILKEVIGCEHGGECNEQCTTAFKIMESELQFYKKMHIPLPRFCPNCRYYQRLKQRNPLRLWHRECMCDPSASSGHATKYKNTTEHFHNKERCPNEFETSYTPDRKEVIYCEACYNAEVV